MARNQDIFRIFLANGGAQHLDEMQTKVARMIADEAQYKQIADTLSLTRNNIDRNINQSNVLPCAKRRNAAKVAERESLIANLKATGRPLMKIPIDGLSPKRLEGALQNANLRMLGDIVITGRIVLARSEGVENGDVGEIIRTLALFGANLPE